MHALVSSSPSVGPSVTPLPSGVVAVGVRVEAEAGASGALDVAQLELVATQVRRDQVLAVALDWVASSQGKSVDAYLALNYDEEFFGDWYLDRVRLM